MADKYDDEYCQRVLDAVNRSAAAASEWLAQKNKTVDSMDSQDILKLRKVRDAAELQIAKGKYGGSPAEAADYSGDKGAAFGFFDDVSYASNALSELCDKNKYSDGQLSLMLFTGNAMMWYLVHEAWTVRNRGDEEIKNRRRLLA